MDIGIIFGEFILYVIFPVILAIVMVLIGMVARKLDKKFNTEIFSNNIGVMTGLAYRAGDYAEEKAAAWAKERGKITGQEKLDLAVAWLMDKVPAITREQAADWIEAILPGRGIGATVEDK